MNVLPADPPVDPHTWERPQMREALARHDISGVFRLLNHSGVSQRRIAALTGQNQSEISDILAGRQVQAYDVLARIADGLGVPRGYMGLAYTNTAAYAPPGGTEDRMERRDFLGLVSKIVMGAALTAPELDLLCVSPGVTPVPHRIGKTEVAQLRTLTAALRSHDATHGGGACREAILAHARWADALHAAACTEQVRPMLLAAVAEIKTLAGWTAHDLGLAAEARRHLTQAVRTTQEADDPAHSATVLYHLGRVPLDNGDPREALKVFQLGQITAQDAHCGSAVALLLTHEALAYAHLGEPRQALTALHRAEDEYARAEAEPWPDHLRFFDRAALQTSAARIHSTLGLTDPRHRDEAITRLRSALEQGPAERARQHTFNLAWLATCTLAGGDTSEGARIGHDAVLAAAALQSTRLIDHFAPLHTETRRHHGGDVDDLRHALEQLRAA